MPPIQEWLGDEHSQPAACFNVKTSEHQDIPGCTNPQPPNPVPALAVPGTYEEMPIPSLIYRLISCEFQPTHCNHCTTELPSTYADSSIRLTVGASAKMQDSPCQHVLPRQMDSRPLVPWYPVSTVDKSVFTMMSLPNWTWQKSNLESKTVPWKIIFQTRTWDMFG